jgi:predicted metal-binding protein
VIEVAGSAAEPVASAEAAAAVSARPARWTDVYLVCKACGKRSSGPAKFKPKALAKAVHKEASRSGRRVRVVMTDCLGLCPKGAITVAHVGLGARPMLAAVKSAKKVQAAVLALQSHDV